MKSILFVDDEQPLLDGLSRMLHSKRGEWQMVFANNAADALDNLRKRPFDLVVADMWMPVMDGAELLEHVRERYPSAIRILLSGGFGR